MLDFDTLADVRSAISQIDLMIDDLLARRDHCLREAARFAAPAGAVGAPESDLQAATPAPTQAQCAPCSGPRSTAS
jgi:chorismate mutase